MVAAGQVRRRHASTTARGARPEREGDISWSLARSGTVSAARWSSRRLPGRVPERARAASRRRRRHGRRACCGHASGRPRPRGGRGAIRARVLDGRRADRARRRDTAKTVWRTASARGPRPSSSGRRTASACSSSASARSARSTADGRKLWAIGLPVGPSGVAFVRKSHRFVLIRYSPATGRSDLVLLQAEADPRRAALPVLGARRLRDARDLAERQVAPRRLGQRRPVALPSAERQRGKGGLEHRGSSSEARRRRRSRRRSRRALSWCCPASP